MYFYFSTALRTYLFSTESSISILICLPVHMIIKESIPNTMICVKTPPAVLWHPDVLQLDI